MTSVDTQAFTDALATNDPDNIIVTWVAVVAVVRPNGTYGSYILRPETDPIDYHRGLLDAGLANIRNRRKP